MAGRRDPQIPGSLSWSYFLSSEPKCEYPVVKDASLCFGILPWLRGPYLQEAKEEVRGYVWTYQKGLRTSGV